jgi:tetratricopeptide (TPR) repeat protein
MNDKKLKQPSASIEPSATKGEPPKPKLSGPPHSGVAARPGQVPPLFRKIDWYTFFLTVLVTLIGYWWTLAPDLTLEDSGELAVASMYAGVPHPPGYPVWTIYTWLFTVLFPFSNIAYRVAFSSAVAGALACGLVALMVSRGSSMMIEGIAELRKIESRWESALCMVSGFVAGLLIGFNGFMWSQAVIVEVYTLSVLSLAGVLVCLLRWTYAPQQRRYLYWAFFWFGISFNNHQSLLVTALGLEVAVLLAAPRLGRDLFFWNVAVYVGGLIMKDMGLMGMLDSMDPRRVNPLFVIYNLVGVVSFCLWVWLAFRTKMRLLELWRDLTMMGSALYLLVIFGVMTNYVTYFEYKQGLFVLFNLTGLACMVGFVYFVLHTTAFGREWLGALACGGAWVLGAAFYVYMPLASMSNPPLNWGYPRTLQGFFHAFTRGQYERINPTTDPGRFIDQVIMYVGGALDEFSFVYLVIALVPFLFYRFMQKRERSWLIGLTAIYLCLSAFLLILLNPSLDRQSRDLNRVFFTASHVMIAMGIGYGLTLIGATLSTLYEQFRKMALIASAAVSVLALLGVAWTFKETHYAVLRLASIVGFVLAVGGAACVAVDRTKLPLKGLLVVFALMPLHPILSHWSDNEQRGHLFGFWFGHDMFTPPFNGADGKPIYPEMTRDTVLFGGTDPGRFNPTYMIFCESFIPPQKRRDPNFDRRDVYLITQNALADTTYLNYIRAHYNRSTEIDPYFFSELLRGPAERTQNVETNLVARLVLPIDRFFTWLGDRIEMRRRCHTSWFKASDFQDLPSLVARLKPGADQDPLSKYFFARFSKETQALITNQGNEKALREALARELNQRMEKEYQERQQLEKDLQELDRRIKDSTAKKTAIQERIDRYLSADHQIFQTNRFGHVALSPRTIRFLKESPAGHTLIRLNRILLEEAYAGLIQKSIGGVYPDLEIHTPSPAESEKSFKDYLADAQRRLDHDRNFPNEPRQVRPGEDVRIVENRVQVSGQVAVMAINGLLTKVIFDANPDHEFFVEESFPLDWMFPHLSPYGIIMKINREPVPEFTEEMVQKDHEFWSQYAQRAIGTWIRNETTVSNICEFVQRVHIRRDYDQFQGDRKFIRDSDAQKAFSKLRSSIGGLYSWRIPYAKTPAEQQRLIREAEFSFKQAYAFCPYSPEALFRYVQLLTTLGRTSEGLLLATTSLALDPYNGQIKSLIDELERIRKQQASLPVPPVPPSPADPAQLNTENAKLEALLSQSPTNLAATMKLVQNYQQAKQNNKVIAVLDRLVAAPGADTAMLLFAAQKYNELAQLPKVAQALQKLVSVIPNNPEAWYDLAGVQMLLNMRTQALASLKQSLENNRLRLAADPNSANLYFTVTGDVRFAALRELAEYNQLIEQHRPPPK